MAQRRPGRPCGASFGAEDMAWEGHALPPRSGIPPAGENASLGPYVGDGLGSRFGPKGGALDDELVEVGRDPRGESSRARDPPRGVRTERPGARAGVDPGLFDVGGIGAMNALSTMAEILASGSTILALDQRSRARANRNFVRGDHDSYEAEYGQARDS